MSTLRSLITAVQALILAAAAPRAITCIIKIMSDNEQQKLYERRLKNLVLFVIVSICALQLLTLIRSAYLT